MFRNLIIDKMKAKVNFETASLCLFDILSFSDGFGLGVRMYCVVVIDFCHSFLWVYDVSKRRD